MVPSTAPVILVAQQSYEMFLYSPIIKLGDSIDMKRIYLLGIFLSLYTAVAFSAEPSTITFSFNDGAQETFSLFSQEIKVLIKQSPFLSTLLDDAGNDTTAVELPMARNTFATILDMISTRINGELPFASKQISEAAQQKIQEKLARLNISELVDVIIASDYFAIDNLFELGVESLLLSRHLQNILRDENAFAYLQKLNILGDNFQELLSQKNEILTNTVFEKAPINLRMIDKLHYQALMSLTLSDDGSRVAAILDDSSLHIIDSATGKSAQQIDKNLKFDVLAQFSHSGSVLASFNTNQFLHSIGVNNSRVDDPHFLKLWDIRSGRLLDSVEIPLEGGAKKIKSVLFSPDDSSVLLIGDNFIYTYTISSKTLTRLDLAHAGEITINKDGIICC